MRCKHLQLSQPVTEHADFTVLHKASHEERFAGQQTWLQRNEPSSRHSQIKIYKPSSDHFGAPESKQPSVISARACSFRKQRLLNIGVGIRIPPSLSSLGLFGRQKKSYPQCCSEGLWLRKISSPSFRSFLKFKPVSLGGLLYYLSSYLLASFTLEKATGKIRILALPPRMFPNFRSHPNCLY